MLLLVCLAVLAARQSRGHALGAEHKSVQLAARMNMADNFKSQSKRWLEALTFNWYSGYSEDLADIAQLKREAETHRLKAMKYFKIFVGLALFLLLVHWKSPDQATYLALILLSVVALVTGLTSPVLAVVAYQDMPVLGATVFQYESKSIASAIAKLFQQQQHFIAVLITVFTVVTPVLKSVLQGAIVFSANLHFSRRVTQVLRAIGKWSMLDVFVIAVLLTYFSTRAGGATDAQVHIGLYFFSCHVILSMIGSYLVSTQYHAE